MLNLADVDFDRLVALLRRKVPTEGISDTKFYELVQNHLRHAQNIDQDNPIGATVTEPNVIPIFVDESVDLLLALEGISSPNLCIQVILILRNAGIIHISRDGFNLTVYMI